MLLNKILPSAGFNSGNRLAGTGSFPKPPPLRRHHEHAKFRFF